MSIAEEVMQKIITGGVVPSNVNGHHGAELRKLLKAHGGVDAEMLSTCKVASSEYRMRLPNGAEVEVIESNFFGPFTDIKVL